MTALLRRRGCRLDQGTTPSCTGNLMILVGPRVTVYYEDLCVMSYAALCCMGLQIAAMNCRWLPYPTQVAILRPCWHEILCTVPHTIPHVPMPEP